MASNREPRRESSDDCGLGVGCCCRKTSVFRQRCGGHRSRLRCHGRSTGLSQGAGFRAAWRRARRVEARSARPIAVAFALHCERAAVLRHRSLGPLFWFRQEPTRNGCTLLCGCMTATDCIRTCVMHRRRPSLITRGPKQTGERSATKTARYVRSGGAGTETMVAGLRATAIAAEHPPEPNVGAPVLDPTDTRSAAQHPPDMTPMAPVIVPSGSKRSQVPRQLPMKRP